MVEPETARRLALSLPDSVEQDHHGFPSYRVDGKIFATHPDEDHLLVLLEGRGPGLEEVLAVLRSRHR